MNRPSYAPTYRYQGGTQSAYNAGLSYFPDVPSYAAMPLGDWETDLATAGGTAIGGPAGGVAAGAASNVIQRWIGGSAVDQQRQERVNYVAQHAVAGNVAAMRIVLGAPPNVSGNERQMWQMAYNLIKSANPTVVRDAEQLGADWLPNSGDTATNYPRLRAYIAAWDAQNPLQAVAGSIGNTISQFFNPTPVTSPPLIGPNGLPLPVAPASHGVSPVLLLGGLALVGVMLASRRRR